MFTHLSQPHNSIYNPTTTAALSQTQLKGTDTSPSCGSNLGRPEGRKGELWGGHPAGRATGCRQLSLPRGHLTAQQATAQPHPPPRLEAAWNTRAPHLGLPGSRKGHPASGESPSRSAGLKVIHRPGSSYTFPRLDDKEAAAAVAGSGGAGRWPRRRTRAGRQIPPAVRRMAELGEADEAELQRLVAAEQQKAQFTAQVREGLASGEEGQGPGTRTAVTLSEETSLWGRESKGGMPDPVKLYPKDFSK